MLLSLNLFTFFNLSVLAIILLLKRPLLFKNIVLSFLVIVPAFAVLFNSMVFAGYISLARPLLFVTFNLNLLWAPAFYLYSLLLTGYKWRFKYSCLVHFVPEAVALVVTLRIFLLSTPEIDSLIAGISNEIPADLMLLNQILVFQTLIYITLSIITLNKFNKSIKQLFSDIHKLSVFWLVEFIVISLVLFFTIMTPIMIFREFNDFMVFLPIGMNFAYFYIVYKTMSVPELFTPVVMEVLALKEEVLVAEFPIEEKADSQQQKQYIEAALKIDNHFHEKKPYLNPDLNIKILSEQISLSVHQLSAVLNQYYGQNFYDFVNKFRVMHAQELLHNSEAEKFTIEAIALACGFRTRSVFYSSFRKETGKTPTEFRQEKEFF